MNSSSKDTKFKIPMKTLIHYLLVVLFLMMYPILAFPQHTLDQSLSEKLKREIALLNITSPEHGRDEKARSRGLLIKGKEDTKVVYVLPTAGGGIRIILRVSFLNLPGSESANVVESKDDWLEVASITPEFGLTLNQRSKILETLSSKKVNYRKNTLIRRNKENKVLLFCQELKFEADPSSIDVGIDVIAQYFSEIMIKDIVLEHRSNAKP